MAVRTLPDGRMALEDDVQLPPLRHWLVTRVNPIDPTQLEQIDVYGHGFEFENNNLAFKTAFVFDNTLLTRITPVFNEWVMVEELSAPPVDASSSTIH